MEGDGCGCSPRGASKMVLVVNPTTGGQLEVSVCPSESVESLKKRLSKRLKVPKERICLLHRDRQLRDGSLEENQLVNGSRLTLLPSVETGLLAQRPEQSVMQALESLSDSQVHDFLSGKAPLNLTMRLGDHMMLIQLQLSTVTPSSSRSSSSSSSSSSSGVKRSRECPAVAVVSPTRKDCCCEPRPQKTGHVLDTRALAEASRNLTKTLKQLSSEVLTSRATTTTTTTATSSSTSSASTSSTTSEEEKKRQGAIIESMHHHGKGVYSGTFSGTLNPALQDKFGRPKRDISTIIHILNDLLCATPQYRGVSRRHAAASAQVQTSDTSNQQTHTPEPTNAENLATRCKMEQLRLIMEERRARRRARREARSAPYGQWSPSLDVASAPSSPQQACTASIAASTSSAEPDAMETSEELHAPEAVLA